VYEGLNDPITIPELLIAVKTLKQGKAAGNDCLLNEYFIESIYILCSHVCDIFNIILNTGCYPGTWMEGVIIPIYKKGDKKEASNYRGITLMSCFSKVFTSIMNRRLEIVCRDNNLISDCQFGFYKVDAVFILDALIQHFLKRHTRLYIVFVDLKRCFDTIYRNGLWFKLHRAGIQGKFLRIIRDMYSKVKSCVKQ